MGLPRSIGAAYHSARIRATSGALRTGSGENGALKRPWLRFFGIGLLLFLVDGLIPSAAPEETFPPLEAPVSDEALLTRVGLERGYHRSDAIVRRRLARNMRFATAQEERSDAELVDEAIALGMHYSDLVVSRRLAQKVTLLIQEQARHPEPSDDELQAYLEAHTERFTEPERVRITQLYFREEGSASEARRALAESLEGAEQVGDALPIPRKLPPLSERELARQLGPSFAAGVMGLPDGGWSAPVESAYGHHLVWVHERRPARRSALEVVRAEVRESLLAERSARKLSDTLAEWRTERGLDTRSEG